MAIHDDRWFECWYDGNDPVLPVYVLFVMPAGDGAGGYIVVDLVKNREIIFRGPTYQDVRDWLTADEYEQIDGRVFVDDGW